MILIDELGEIISTPLLSKVMNMAPAQMSIGFQRPFEWHRKHLLYVSTVPFLVVTLV